MNTTCSNPTKIFTLDDLEKAIKSLSSHHFDRPSLPSYKPSRFEKLMNKLGWYKKTTVYVIDKNAFVKLWQPYGMLQA